VQIQQYLDEHKRNVLEDLAVGDLSVLSAHSDQTYDTITVRVLAACADYDVDDEHGRVIRGDKRVGNWTEDWTFQRSAGAKTLVTGGVTDKKGVARGLSHDRGSDIAWFKDPAGNILSVLQTEA